MSTNERRTKKVRKLAIESLESRRVMATLPYGAEFDDTGEFMLGRVAVTPVFLESDGSIDANTENWNPAQISQVISNIQTGLNWWTQLLATKSSVHTLSFVIDTTYATKPVATPYEPISRRSDDHNLWASRFLADIGFSSGTTIDRVRAFNNSQREKLETDWAFTIFVANSQADGDGGFATGGSFTRAFAFAGGLYEVVPSTRPASTYSHETGHMFWARDEYIGGGRYADRRGYYNAQNTNAFDLNPIPNFQQELSIMSAGSTLQTAYDTVVTADATLAQIGWKDSDRDGIFDVLDVPFSLEGTGRFDEATGTYRFVGHSSVQTLANRNSSGTQNDITLNKIGKIEYRVNNGPWTTFSTPNQYVVDIDMSIPLGTTISGTIEIRTSDPRIGITSNVFNGTIGAAPDTTTQNGIQGFVWHDADRNNAWNFNEAGLAGMSVTIVNSSNQPIVFQTIVEPDTFPSGQYTNTSNGVRLDCIGEDTLGAIGVFEDPNATTGTKIFKPYSNSASGYADAFRGTRQQLRARFDTPTSYASIDAIAIVDDTDVRIDAFAADGSLIKRVEQKGLVNGQKITIEVGTDTAQIASVIISGFNNSYVKLDNLRFGPKNSAKTASDGSYLLANLPAGNYNLLVQTTDVGYEFTNPSTGLQSVVFATGTSLSHIDFGLKRIPSPWQNQALKEDVDNSGSVNPLDVLVLINEINRAGSRPLTGSGQSVPPFVDVDGDRNIGPLDVLMVINYINTHSSSRGVGAGGEGETTAFARMPITPSSAPFTSFVIDARAERSETRIVANSTRVSRLGESGAEKCGCPACTSCAPSGESSPAIIDIATASKFANSVSSKTSKPDLSSNSSLANLDELLKNWNS